MGNVRIDDEGLRDLARVLGNAGSLTQDEAKKVVARGAFNIKKDAKETLGPLRRAPAYPSSITYDTYVDAEGAHAEIGPDKQRRQGALGNLIEFGSVNNPPHPHMLPAGERERPRFESALLDAAERAVEGR